MAISERQLLDALSRMLFVDSAELALILGEPHATVHRALADLLADGITGRVGHGTAHLASSQRYHLTANGIRETAGFLGFETPSDFVRAYPVSREWLTLLIRRMDAVAAVYRLAASMSPGIDGLRSHVEFHRRGRFDATITLHDGRGFGVVRQGLALRRRSLYDRLRAIAEYDYSRRPSVVLVLASRVREQRLTAEFRLNADLRDCHDAAAAGRLPAGARGRRERQGSLQTSRWERGVRRCGYPCLHRRVRTAHGHPYARARGKRQERGHGNRRGKLDRAGQAHRLLEAVPAGSGRRYPRLPSGLDDDAPAVPDLDVQVVPVQEQHAHQGRGVSGVGFNVDTLAVPQHGYAVNVVRNLTAVGESRPAYADEGKPQLRHHCWGQSEKPVEAGIDDGPYIPCLPRRAVQSEAYYGFVCGVHHALDHWPPRRGRPPKCRSAGYPTRSLKTLTAPGRFSRRRSVAAITLSPTAQSPVSTSMATTSPWWPASTFKRMSRS